MKIAIISSVAAAVIVAAVAAFWQFRVTQSSPWTEGERLVLRSLWLGSLPELPADPGNAVADNPLAAEFGGQLFIDSRLSANGAVSCATCHQPERRFTDGLLKGQAIGTSRRNTPSIVGTAYSPWLYWDGRRDSQWAQALAPLEDPNEHATSRQQVVLLIAEDENYRSTYETLFGPLPDLSAERQMVLDTAFANVGKAIAAFERTVMPTASRFDNYVAAVFSGEPDRQHALLSEEEKRGLRLFIGKANCTQCHNGPLLTNNEFHNTGVLNAIGDHPDKGRVTGVLEVMADPFNCLGSFSDDPGRRCAELEFARTGPELIGAVRTPSLRNLGGTAPYMHKGQLPSIAQVLLHYNNAPDAMIGHNEAKPLGLSRRELRQLESFLATLDAPPSVQNVGGKLVF